MFFAKYIDRIYFQEYFLKSIEFVFMKVGAYIFNCQVFVCFGLVFAFIFVNCDMKINYIYFNLDDKYKHH